MASAPLPRVAVCSQTFNFSHNIAHEFRDGVVLTSAVLSPAQ
jgi:hypothetical protein